MKAGQHDILDAYLRGELSGKELDAFQEGLAKDPVLKSEVAFEEEVVKGLKEFRKGQLKARLNSIDVPQGWMAPEFSTAMLKLAGTVVIGTFIGYGLYTSLDEMESFERSGQVVKWVDGPQESKEIQWDFSLDELPMEDDRNKREEKSAVSDPRVVAERMENESNTPLNHSKPSVAVDVPTVDLPEPDEVSEGSQFEPEEVSVPLAAIGDIVSRGDAIDVETIDRKTETIKYKYFDGKLYLYGDFKRKPYEILEINSSDARKVYLYHNMKYYLVRPTDKVEELPLATDPKLIRELEIVRVNKSN